MTKYANMLYGSTSKSGSVPRVCNDGPVFSCDDRLILSESFTAFKPAECTANIEADLDTLLSNEDYIESWRVWDCCQDAWADVDLILYRFETYDLVVRCAAEGICVWRGALDQHKRINVSRNSDECNEKCWQWVRVPNGVRAEELLS